MRSKSTRGSCSLAIGVCGPRHEMFAEYAHEYPESQLPAVMPGSSPISSDASGVPWPNFCAMSWSMEMPAVMSLPAVFTGCAPVRKHAPDRA
jgi:hypothetical protein